MRSPVTSSKVAILLAHMIRDLGYDLSVRRESTGFAVTAIGLDGDKRLVRASDPSEAIFELAKQVGISSRCN